MADIGGLYEVDGIVRQREELEQLLTTNPQMEKRLQAAIRKVLMEVRRAVAQGATSSMRSDPRQAYKAVKTAVYRQILGGSVSILNKKKGKTQFSDYEPPRKLRAGQRGGNRKVRSSRTQDLVHYAGPDRAFILRFLNSGTGDRTIKFDYNDGRKVDKWNKHPNTGYRGNIKARNFFAASSHSAMRAAAAHLQQLIDEIIKQELK